MKPDDDILVLNHDILVINHDYYHDILVINNVFIVYEKVRQKSIIFTIKEHKENTDNDEKLESFVLAVIMDKGKKFIVMIIKYAIHLKMCLEYSQVQKLGVLKS